MAVIDLDALSGPRLDPDKCPQIKRDGKQCGNSAGHRTDHVGFARCWKHGGNSEAGRKHGAKLAALAAMRDTGEVDVNPLDALLYCVRRASWLSAFHRMRAEASELAGEDAGPLFDLERQAMGDLAKWSKMAIDAGVAERQVRIAERMGERLSAAFEAAMGVLVSLGVQVSAEQRMAAVRTYAGELARHEGGGEIETSARDV